MKTRKKLHPFGWGFYFHYFNPVKSTEEVRGGNEGFSKKATK
jgi:hypothetical protein